MDEAFIAGDQEYDGNDDKNDNDDNSDNDENNDDDGEIDEQMRDLDQIVEQFKATVRDKWNDPRMKRALKSFKKKS